MQTTTFSTIVRHLTQDQTPRVWSLLISVFGELAQENGSQISGSLLRLLTERIGIKPEAMRVAIHRLRKEGWIDSQRNGRTSAYFLTPWGRTQSAEATPRIYGSNPASEHAWLAVFNPAEPPQSVSTTGVWVSSNILITSREPNKEQAFVSTLTAQSPLPEWMRGKVCEDLTLRMSEDFAEALDNVARALNALPPLGPLEIAALRVLLVHGWRRIVLKTPVLPDYVFPRDWCGPQCRAKVAALLTQYPNPGLDRLEAVLSQGFVFSG